MIDYIYLHYVDLFFSIVLGLCLLLSLNYAFSNNNTNLLKKHSPVLIILLCILLVIILGNRKAQGDSFAYAFSYEKEYNTLGKIDWHTEWAWGAVSYFCRSVLHLPVWGYFSVIAAGYIGFTFCACYRLLKENPYMAMMFCLSSYSFVAFGCNTLRSGFACALLLLAFSFWIERRNYIISIVLALLAFGCHRSCGLPIAAIIGASFVVKKPNSAIIIWFSSLLIYIALPSFFSRYAGALGMDDRISNYMALSGERRLTYNVGFRVDFLIYSFLPILFTWYIIAKKNIQDKKFALLANTYILANAAWLQFIRLPFTDRFAYLSWFLFPVVLAYGAIRVPIWKDQDRRAAGILSLQVAFTFFMWYIK